MKNKLPYIFSFLVLIVPAVHIIRSLVLGHLIEWGFMVIFPLCALVISLLFASVKKVLAVRLVFPYIISVGVIFICGFFGTLGHTEYRHSSFDWYAAYSMTSGTCDRIDTYEYDLVNIFPSDSTTVIYQYNEESFDDTVKRLDEEYTFYTDLTHLDCDYDPNPFFTVEGFDFRIVVESGEEWLEYFPKFVHLIGVNEQTKEIADIMYYSGDLDYIPDLPSFVEYDCGWSYIMKKHKAHRV